MADSRKQIVDAALGLIGKADLGQLLGFMTPEDLAIPASVSAGTVRYQFRSELQAPEPGSKRAVFDRMQLGLELVEQVLAQIRVTVEHNAAVYENVAGALAGLQDLERVLIAIISDLDSYTPGASEGVDPTARERVFLLALASCDENQELASRLRDFQAANTARHVRVYDAFLKRTSRHLVDHTSGEQLADLISMLLEGASLRRRFDPGFDMTTVAKAAIRIFWAFTVMDGDAEPAYAEELMASVST